MLLTIYLTILFCTAIALMLLAAVAFIQDKKLFSSAPKEILAVIEEKPEELFFGARAIGLSLFIIGVLIAIAIWGGFRRNYTFEQFFFRFTFILTIYKIADMVLIDDFLLLKLKFFQYYFPETESVMRNRKYGFNLKSQLLKLLIVFPALSALTAWACIRFGGR